MGSSDGEVQVTGTGHPVVLDDQEGSKSHPAKENGTTPASSTTEPEVHEAGNTKSYIITFKPSTTDEELNKYEEQVKSQGGKIRHKYNSAILKGFAVSVPENSLQGLSADPNIQFVEPDGEVHI